MDVQYGQFFKAVVLRTFETCAYPGRDDYHFGWVAVQYGGTSKSMSTQPKYATTSHPVVPFGSTETLPRMVVLELLRSTDHNFMKF